jgi:hypothetical protein
MGLIFLRAARLPQNSASHHSSSQPARFLRSRLRRAWLGGVSALIAATAGSAAQFVVSWEDKSDAEDGYRVERSVDGVNFFTVAKLPADSTTYTDTDLVAGSTYSYRVQAFNGFATSPYSNVASASTSPEILAVGSHSTSRLANLSVRARAGTDDATLIIGFVVTGASKSILVRAVGPGIAAFASSTMPDPSLVVMNGATPFASNDNWGGATDLRAAFNRLGAFGLGERSLDAALLRALDAHPYTVLVSGTPGVALAEIYDADTSSNPSGRLANVSARARADTGGEVLIVGFVISGDTPLPVLIRAAGPSLASAGVSGVMANPQLCLFHGQTPLKYNDDWNGDATLTAAFSAAGASSFASPTSKDAAIFNSLPPGAYTAIVSGVGSTSGVALAEVYELP